MASRIGLDDIRRKKWIGVLLQIFTGDLLKRSPLVNFVPFLAPRFIPRDFADINVDMNIIFF